MTSMVAVDASSPAPTPQFTEHNLKKTEGDVDREVNNMIQEVSHDHGEEEETTNNNNARDNNAK